MADKVRFLYVLKNAQGDYLMRRGRLTQDFTKARVFKRKCDATNSSHWYPSSAMTPHKVVLVDTN